MSFWKKKDNLIITGFVAVFFVGLTYWYDLCPLRAAYQNGSVDPLSIPFVDQNQKPHTLKEFQGPMIINFWATWCPVCVKRMGSLNTFAKKFQEKGGQILTISEDSSFGIVKSYFARHQYTNLTSNYLDSDGKLMHALGASGLPTFIFIDAKGKEVARVSGGIDWESHEVRQMVKKHFDIDISEH
jgi:thiol-disulfide isomerase/thioredoxin